jgi:uncharacterized membrane protein YdjX (TVP38/TMEM64 family)
MFKIIQLLSRIILGLVIIAPAFILQFAAQTKEVQELAVAIQAHLPIYLITLLGLKAFSIIYVPLPGAAFTLASLPLIGWQVAYLIDILGSALGATLAFYLGKKYGFSILNKILGRTIATKIAAIKLKPKNQFEAAIFLRLAMGGMLSDGLAWGASLIGFRYVPFMIGYLVAHIITTLPVFYIVASAISFNSWVVVGSVMLVSWLIMYKFKGRYFE